MFPPIVTISLNDDFLWWQVAHCEVDIAVVFHLIGKFNTQCSSVVASFMLQLWWWDGGSATLLAMLLCGVVVALFIIMDDVWG